MRRRTDLAKRFERRTVPVVKLGQGGQRIYQRYSTMSDKYRDLYQRNSHLIGYDQVGLRQGVYS